MKKILFFNFCILLLSLCSCQTNPLHVDTKDAYCFFCAKDQKPVAGYSVFDDEKMIAVSNVQGFVCIPPECIDRVLVAKKAGWETVRFTVSQSASGTVLCISVRRFEELCSEAARLLSCGDVQGSEKIIAKMDGESSVIRTFESVAAYKSGDLKRAQNLLMQVNSEDKAVSAFGLLLNARGSDEISE